MEILKYKVKETKLVELDKGKRYNLQLMMPSKDEAKELNELLKGVFTLKLDSKEKEPFIMVGLFFKDGDRLFSFPITKNGYADELIQMESDDLVKSISICFINSNNEVGSFGESHSLTF